MAGKKLRHQYADSKQILPPTITVPGQSPATARGLGLRQGVMQSRVPCRSEVGGWMGAAVTMHDKGVLTEGGIVGCC